MISLINIILSIYVCFVIYNLALSFIGVYKPIKKSISPMLLFAFFLFISKIIFNAPPLIHTVVVVIVCTVIVCIFNRMNIIISLISSLLVMIIIILGNLLLICPLLKSFGVNLVNETNSIDWVIFTIGELFIPTIILIINKIKKKSLLSLIVNN